MNQETQEALQEFLKALTELAKLAADAIKREYVDAPKRK